MAQAQRTDCHRPGALIPAHYEDQFSFSLPSSSGGGHVPGFLWDCVYDKRPGRFTEFGFVPDGPLGTHGPDDRCCAKRFLETHKAARLGTPGKCDVCGAHYVHGTVFLHTPTGEVVLMGHDCADKYGAMYDMSAAELHRERMQHALAKAVARKQNEEARNKYLAERPELAAAFALLDAPDQTPRQLTILRDMREKLVQYKSLSDKQIAFAIRLANEVRNPPPVVVEPEACAVPAFTEARPIITGTILHSKWVESDYGGAQKMLLAVDVDGKRWKAWGTVPSGVEGTCQELKGRTITIRAQVQVKQGEVGFAFLKRPTLYVPPAPKKPRPTKAQRLQRKARDWFSKMGRQALYWGSMETVLNLRTEWAVTRVYGRDSSGWKGPGCGAGAPVVQEGEQSSRTPAAEGV
jgi:hypothetical protein